MNGQVVTYKELAKMRAGKAARAKAEREEQRQRIIRMAAPAELRRLCGWTDSGELSGKIERRIVER